MEVGRWDSAWFVLLSILMLMLVWNCLLCFHRGTTSVYVKVSDCVRDSRDKLRLSGWLSGEASAVETESSRRRCENLERHLAAERFNIAGEDSIELHPGEVQGNADLSQHKGTVVEVHRDESAVGGAQGPMERPSASDRHSVRTPPPAPVDEKRVSLSPTRDVAAGDSPLGTRLPTR